MEVKMRGRGEDRENRRRVGKETSEEGRAVDQNKVDRSRAEYQKTSKLKFIVF